MRINPNLSGECTLCGSETAVDNRKTVADVGLTLVHRECVRDGCDYWAVARGHERATLSEFGGKA